jgi:hypothetical protein
MNYFKSFVGFSAYLNKRLLEICLVLVQERCLPVTVALQNEVGDVTY